MLSEFKTSLVNSFYKVSYNHKFDIKLKILSVNILLELAVFNIAFGIIYREKTKNFKTPR